MANRQFLIAYSISVTRADLTPEELETRIKSVNDFAEKAIGYPITPSNWGNGRLGLIYWPISSPHFRWEAYRATPEEASIWLNIPANANQDNHVDSLALARDYVEGRFTNQDMGAPCAVVHANRETLSIMADQMGMARLYQLDFPEFGTIWTTRPGLGHVFVGIDPAPTVETWAGMATTGWSINGAVHLGHGSQIRPGATIRANRSGTLEVNSSLGDWLESAWSSPTPSASEQAESMKLTLRSADWWSIAPTADLSGGKDSRVTAAAAIVSRITSTVRTTMSDTGDVKVAKQLVSLAPFPIEHTLQEPSSPKVLTGGTLERFQALQRYWEGAFFAKSAIRAQASMPIKFPAAARINGLGGEALQGGNFAPRTARDRYEAEPLEEGFNWLVKRTTIHGIATSDLAREYARSSISTYLDLGRNLKLETAQQLLDLFYNFSEMPYWAVPQANPSTILPFYGPQLLPRMAHSIRTMLPFGEIHKLLLKELMPEWAGVGFYKGSPKTRNYPWLWEAFDWNFVKNYLEEFVSMSDLYSTDESIDLLRGFENYPDGKKPLIETAFARMLWNASFDDYAKEVAEAANRTRNQISKICP